MSDNAPDDHDFTPTLKPISRRIRELKEQRRKNAYLFKQNSSLYTELAILLEIKYREPDPEEIRDAYIDTSLSFLNGGDIENAGAHAALDTAIECLTPYDADEIDFTDRISEDDSGTTIGSNNS